MKTQICLVSDQAAANLLPALDGSLQAGRIVLVVTAQMRQKAENLRKVLLQSSRQVEFCDISNAQDFHGMQNELLELAARQPQGQEVMLNITGGTKLMSMAVQSVAEQAGWRMFYVDVHTDTIIWLDREPSAPQPLQQHLKLRHYLQSYGFALKEKPARPSASAAQQQLTQTLASQAHSLKDALSSLNALAQDAENRRSLSVPLPGNYQNNYPLQHLIDLFESVQALEQKGSALHFASEADRDFVKGGWLELHTMQALNQAHGAIGVQDKAIGLEVVHEATSTQNELDIAFMARNRLFVIECKTARIDKPQSSGGKPRPAKANDTLFKLAENCSRIGGLGAKGMLVSYRALNDPEMRLAKALGIAVVAGQETAQLPQKLKQWAGH